MKFSDEAVFAANTENIRRQLPLDIAEKNATEHPSTATLAIFEKLRDMKKGMNFRLKIQQEKSRRVNDSQAAQDKLKSDRDKVLEESRALMAVVMGLERKMYAAAESIRAKDREKALEKAGEDAIKEAEAWLETAEGSQFLEEQVVEIQKEFKQLMKEGKMKKVSE